MPATGGLLDVSLYTSQGISNLVMSPSDNPQDFLARSANDGLIPLGLYRFYPRFNYFYQVSAIPEGFHPFSGASDYGVYQALPLTVTTQEEKEGDTYDETGTVYNCEFCDYTTTDINDLTGHDDQSYCPSCVDARLTTCERCDDLTEDTYTVENDGTQEMWCEHCYVNHARTCSSCDTTFSEHSYTWSNGRNDDCVDCSGSNETIKSYSYKPSPTFYRLPSDSPKALVYGFELEVESRHDDRDDLERVAEDLQDALAVYCKEDGSLSKGMEIVSHPCSLQYLKDKKVFNRIYELSDGLLSSYYKRSCGFHVHMDKSAFSNLHLYKFMRFHEQNVAFIHKIAQRGDNNYTYFTNEIKNLPRYAKHKSGNSNRYYAINLDNKHTIELRYFKGNLKPERLYKNIEFLESLYYYTQKTSIKALTVRDFIAYVANNHKAYPNLHTYLHTFYLGEED